MGCGYSASLTDYDASHAIKDLDVEQLESVRDFDYRESIGDDEVDVLY